MKTATIRKAEPTDAIAIHELLMDLAEFEKITHIVEATPTSTRIALFGEKPCAEALVAEIDGATVGTAIFFHNYSTFVGRQGLYLEDIYIQPAHRSSGIGKAMLVELAKLAEERNCGRMEWTVLDWNARAISFYESFGAQVLDEWRIVRLGSDGIAKLAGS
jgi:GNAT superfamily N-acetyltransferase